MKKLVSAILIAVLFVTAFSSCTTQNSDNNKLKIVTTIFPVYDWIRSIVGECENVEVTMLIDEGVDFHNYQANTDDIVKIASSDIFVYVGGESDGWIDKLPESKNDRLDINLMDKLKTFLFEEELVEGMEGEEEEGAEGEEEEAEFDEHIWLSLKVASEACKILSDAISSKDKANEEKYHSNTEAYLGELSALNDKYKAAVNAGTKKTILFGDRFPFRYMVEDYGLDYYAAFIGCSAESEASFETIIFLAKKVDELKLKTIIKLEGSDGKIAETIKNNTTDKNAEIITFNSLQNISKETAEGGATYLGIMKNNLEALKTALR